MSMNIKDMKVLVCDDSILSRKKLKDCIIAIGCSEVYEAADGEEAVTRFKEYHPDRKRNQTEISGSSRLSFYGYRNAKKRWYCSRN